MAQFTRTNGDFKPQINYDATSYTNTGVNTSTSAVTVQPAGPVLEFFTIALASVATDGAVTLACMQAIEQLATIMMYELTDTGTDTMALAIYPVGAWTTGTLDTATGGTTTASATFTN